MDLDQIRELFAGQGAVFWAAVTAVALGLTLLAVSLVFQMRRMMTARGRARLRPGATTATAAGDRTSDARSVRRDAARAAPGPAPEFLNVDTAPTSWSEDVPAHVLDRLRAAADSLERIHAALRPEESAAATGADSPLKAARTGVDYVYKSGRA